MDECVRLEEALQADESRKAEERQSPRPKPDRRRSRWPFSLQDFAKTDEYRLPPLSTQLAAFSPGPAEASPRRRGTNPSSPRIAQRNDNQHGPSQSAPRSPKRQVETAVERLPSHTEGRTREERRAIYSTPSTPSTSKYRDRHRDATPQSPALPVAVSMTDLRRLRDSKNPRRRYSLPIAPRDVSEPEPMQIAEIVETLRRQEAAGPVTTDSQTFANTRIEFKAACRAWIPVKLDTDPPQHRTLMMMDMVTEFPATADLTIYEVETRFSRTNGSMLPEPKIADRAGYPLNKGDSETGEVKKLDMVTRSNVEDTSFTLELKNFKSREIVIHVALLLEQNQRETTESFYAGVGFHLAGVDWEGNPIQRMLIPGEDIRLSLKPERLRRYRKLLVSKDLNLHKLLLSWVGSE